MYIEKCFIIFVGGGRFKRFATPEAAQAYVEHGDDSVSESFFSYESSSSFTSSRIFNTSFSESITTYPSVTPIVLNRLRRAIETQVSVKFLSYLFLHCGFCR